MTREFIITVDYLNGHVIRVDKSQLFDENDPSAEAYASIKYNAHKSRIGGIRVVRVYPEFDSTGRNLYNESSFWYQTGDEIWLASTLILRESINYGRPLDIGQTVLRYMFDDINNYWYFFEFEINECTSSCGTSKLNGVLRNHSTDYRSGRAGYINVTSNSGYLLSHVGMLTARVSGSKEPFDIIATNDSINSFQRRRRPYNIRIQLGATSS